MIFIAGIQPKTKLLESSPRICLSCGSPQAYLKRVDHYLSIFFVPIIPIRRGVPMLRCENCGAVLTETGPPLWTEGIQEEKRCAHCGRVMEGDFSYCPYCGTRLK